jgi:hypothetical protein
MRILAGSLGVCLCITLLGCQQNDTRPVSQDKDVISGKVYLDDKIVNYGVVAFYAANVERPLKSPIYPDGRYNIRNPPPGEYRLVITTGQPPVPAAGGSSKSPPPTFKQIDLPEKYSSKETTDLKYVVKEGLHTYDIKLESVK